MAKKTLVAVRHPLVQNIVNEQIGNLTQRHSRKDGVYRYLKVVLDDFCQEVAHLTMSSAGSRPRIGQPGWKREVANLSNFLCNRTGEFDVLFDRTRRQHCCEDFRKLLSIMALSVVH